ncbi:transcriptional regulator [Tepidanaerobacter syntrophicus]|uniref:MerR family transcriptional regulator n=1 Tax=Tepidanaerobacter syntrophicus TaxID=224999 RepID=UPI0022EFAB2E|nr:MerR family transcriptional regulator [Tepidanaerobacter syntrophicus]GLI19987.1 transcriptional regulator [Tepidanaerobacter syntrophicus]
MNMLTIGKMARLNNISEQALRLYDKIGLLKPDYVDEQTGYRYYNIKQCARLDMIAYMKELGMSLKQIKEHLDREDVNVILEVLRRQKILIDKDIEELFRKQKAIIRYIENYNRYLNFQKESFKGPIVEHIPSRKIYCYKCSKNVYECKMDSYEYILRELKNHIILHDLPSIYFCNVGSIIRKNTLEKEELASNEIFVFVDDEFTSDTGIEKIPEGDFACIYFNDFNFEKEKECAGKLIRYIKENSFEIIGDYVCEVIAELPIFPHDSRNMSVKLQIPIKI